jgi:hypothetical protein
MGFLSILFDWLKGLFARAAEVTTAAINLAIELAVAVLKDQGE